MILKELKIENTLGTATNCYIIGDEDAKEAMCIDPAGDCNKILEMLDILGMKLKYIYLTHCHADHIGALEELREKTGATFLIHRVENDNLRNPIINLTANLGIKNVDIDADARVDDGDLLHVGDIELKVIHTPGHTSGGTSLYVEKEKLIFTGDTLFKGTYGRTDLATGSKKDIMNSINNKLLSLPDETVIYPGHGIPGMIGEEKENYI